ncbi:ABC transporter substrate-binding protein [Maritimibacter alkaliphilus]|uniref:ABC transporter substrate-binding protein n=1 Tax=Maritimibacter alkaliphilus TaxID=404236 RepID=UPI001C942FBD|nr:ABC transporter substrate-binding protein [Maritimibacter alkaliphilus]MBY6092647.1 ABC transporter substrate-binding protein [Maritimibacter alkaliphilus]
MKTFKKVALAGAALMPLCLSTPAVAGPDDNSLTWSTDREISVPFVWWDTVTEMGAMMYHVYDTLVYRNPETMEYEPLLATSWEWIDDTTLEFKLREGVTYHDGSDFTADDVVKSYSMLLDPETGVRNASFVSWMGAVEKIDDYTVRLNLEKPFPAALEFLAGTRMAVPAAEVWDDLPKKPDGTTDFSQMPSIGTGPYELASFIPGEEAVLTRNPAYFEGPKGQPEIETITFRTIPDQETRVAELMVGGLDWITDLPSDMIDQLGAMPGVKVINGPDMRIAYLVLDRLGKSGDTPVADVRVRKAIAHAIDREAIAKQIVGPAAEVVNAACYPTQVGCTDDIPHYDYDPEKAKALLAEAGYPDGITVEMGAYRERPHSEAIMGYLAQAGIDTKLTYLQWSGLRERLTAGDIDMAVRTWASSGLNDISAIASVQLSGAPDDICQSPEIQAALAKGDTTVDPEARKAAYKEALTMVAEEVCWIPLFSYSKTYGVNEALEFFPTADGFPLFYLAKWAE